MSVLSIASPLNSPSKGPLLSIPSGAIAGLLATSITQPFDMIKTRIQLSPMEYPNLWYGGKKIMRVSSLLCPSLIVQEEGFRGFFKGMSPRLARKVISAAIVWTGYEEILKIIAKRKLESS